MHVPQRVSDSCVFGLLRRRECIVPTKRGWLVIFLLLFALGEIVLRSAYPFLATNHPIDADVLIAEGWMDDLTTREVIEEFRRNHYSMLLVTGGPIEKGAMFSDFKTIADFSAAILVKMGVDGNLVHAVPSENVLRDRTYTSALDVKKWLREHRVKTTKMNLISLGTHSRRSWLLFQKAFGGEMKIGIIAAKDRGFDTRLWWHSSEGFRTVVGEAIAYFYARFFFWP